MDTVSLAWGGWFSLAITLVSLLLLASSRVAADMVLMGAMSLLLLSGVLTPQAALKGFANEGLMTIATLYVIAAALRDTGAVAMLARGLLGRPKHPTSMLLRVMLPTSLLSAFINNTPVAAMFIPAVQAWARSLKQPASRFLIPLSYATILGGTCTLIGTSTNLVVNGLLIEHTGGNGVGMFEIALLGIPLLLICTLFITLFSHRLLPVRATPAEQLASAREYSVQMEVSAESPLCGKSIQEAGLRQLSNCYLVDIERQGHLLHAVPPAERLHEGDRLFFIGTAEAVAELRAIRGLAPADDQPGKLAIDHSQRRLVEAVISPAGHLAGQSVRDSRFRSHYNAAILSVSRNGTRLHGKIGDLELRGGDTVLMETGNDFCREHGNSRAFLLVHPLEETPAIAVPGKAPLALTILGLMIAANALGLLPMLQAALIAAGSLLLTRCISVSAARNSIDLSVLAVIGASFALGQALTQTGAAQYLANHLLGSIHTPLLALAMVYVMTTLFTEVITNNAAAVLMFPVASAIAEQMQVSAMPFVIAIMFAASASFMTPIGYQTNLMVYGPGGYRFSDYLRVGIPLNILAALVSVLLIPVFWPFS